MCKCVHSGFKIVIFRLKYVYMCSQRVNNANISLEICASMYTRLKAVSKSWSFDRAFQSVQEAPPGSTRLHDAPRSSWPAEVKGGRERRARGQL